MKINKDTLIGECISSNLKAAEYLVGLGIPCIGCSAAQFETIETGLKAHGKTNKEINKIIKQLNKIKNE